MAERDSLREANEELRCAQLQNRGLAQAGEFLGSPIRRDLEEGVGKPGARSWGGSRPVWVLGAVPWSLFLTVFFSRAFVGFHHTHCRKLGGRDSACRAKVRRDSLSQRPPSTQGPIPPPESEVPT